MSKGSSDISKVPREVSSVRPPVLRTSRSIAAGSSVSSSKLSSARSTSWRASRRPWLDAGVEAKKARAKSREATSVAQAARGNVRRFILGLTSCVRGDASLVWIQPELTDFRGGKAPCKEGARILAQAKTVTRAGANG